ncbi:MAG: pyridoxine 5'-phosphate synthase [bacterium]
MTTIPQRLYINIDHIATIRQARRGDEPVPVNAVSVCERAGADGITAHLREDRRHMQDADIDAIAAAVSTVFNLEIAGTDEMIALAERLRPYQVTIVPERREEVTTEGGLNVAADPPRLARSLERLRNAGIRTSLFIDADRESVTRSRDLGADSSELHTGRYAHASSDPATLAALRDGAALGASLGLAVHAGHGLTTSNVGPVAAIMEIEELNIGHHVVSRAVFVGLETAIRELRTAMDAARRGP